jgi:hypothetical protein
LIETTAKRQVTIIREHGDLRTRGFIANRLVEIRDRFGARFRTKRMAEFERRFPSEAYEEIIDIGGTFGFWEGSARKVTLVNPAVPASSQGTITSVSGDGTQVPFPDRSFSLAFSNSAIEHVPCRDDMRKFAEEMRRVGDGLYCQTPNRWFPFDVHYLCFLWHWWPGLLRNYYIVRYLTGFGWAFKPDRKAVQAWADHVHLLGKKDFQSLFPDCRIEHERFMGMTKSFIAVRLVSAENKAPQHESM